MYPVPYHCKNNAEHVESILQTVKKGKVQLLGHSAGGREIKSVEYGQPNQYTRRANYSSAMGAGDYSCYAQKDHPCLVIIGGVHGGEFEGTAAMCNLISLLETGVDLAGNRQDILLSLLENVHLILVPRANPDGRDRMPFEGVGGMSFEEFRQWDQGNWSDGSLCGWPDCKKEHPIRSISFLGGYYNDNGINLMHDNFFDPMAEETRVLLRLTAENAPDMVWNLHGSADAGYGIYCGALSQIQRERAMELETRLDRCFTAKGRNYEVTDCGKVDPSINLTTAISFACGALSITWESYQGVNGKSGEATADVYDRILEAHYDFFTESLRYLWEWYQK